MSTYYPSMVNAASVAGIASNVSHTDNPPFTEGDFLEMYPQFTAKIPAVMLGQFIKIANVTVFEDWWGETWKMGMGWFIAHFCTMYLQSAADAESSAAQVIKAAETRGLQTSKSVDSVSVSYDFSMLAQDLAGWGGFLLSSYGVQYVTFAKMIGKGGMYAW